MMTLDCERTLANPARNSRPLRSTVSRERSTECLCLERRRAIPCAQSAVQSDRLLFSLMIGRTPRDRIFETSPAFHPPSVDPRQAAVLAICVAIYGQFIIFLDICQRFLC